MRTRIAINGIGRLGRAIVKLALDEPAFELGAINDLIEVDNLAYLRRFDVYRRYAKPIAVESGNLNVAGRPLRTLGSNDSLDLSCKELGIELVFEFKGGDMRTKRFAKGSPSPHDVHRSVR